MSDSKSWGAEADEEAQSTEQASVQSADSIPVVQNPLGSAIMAPRDTHQ